MDINISPLLSHVNKSAVLTSFGHNNKFAYMRYGERLKLARGNRTQEWLASEAKVSQSLIWQLENSQTAKGSQYTTRFARVLGISADWLADEIGEMTPTVYTTTDPMLGEILKALEPRAEYFKETALKTVLNTIDLVDHVQESAPKAPPKPDHDELAPPDVVKVTVNVAERRRAMANNHKPLPFADRRKKDAS